MRCAPGSEDLVKKYLINNLLITSWNDSLENIELNIEMKSTYFLLVFFMWMEHFYWTVLFYLRRVQIWDLICWAVISSSYIASSQVEVGAGGARAPRHFLHPLLWGMRPWQKEWCTLLAILIGCSLYFCVKRKSETLETCKNWTLF